MGKLLTRKFPGLVLVVVLLMAAALAGCGNKNAADQTETETKVPVTVADVVSGTIDDGTVVSGKLEALSSADVVPSGAGGKVAQVKVDLGSNVAQGQVIIVLENDLESAGLSQAQAQLNMARSSYQIASDNYQRGKQLVEQGAIAQATFDVQYEQGYEQAKQALAQAQAGLKVAQEQYDYTIIKSPISGVITSRNVNPGEMASPGLPVVTVVNLDKVVVQATVAENEINKIKQGQSVDVFVDAVSATPFKGTVTNIAPAADQVSKAFPIKVQINNPDHTLKPGMFAEVHLTGESKQALLVPREAVVKIDGRDTVWVIKDNTASSCPVTVGVSDGKNIEIKEGLKQGEQVVVLGQDTLRDNTKVDVKN